MKTDGMKQSLQNEKGFTLIELMMVVVILGILVQISFTFAIDLKTRTYDSVAISDGKNLMTSIVNSFVGAEDVDFNCTDCSGAIGDLTTDGDPRNPIFTLSNGVRVILYGENKLDGKGFIEAYVYHVDGTDDGLAPGGSGKREFYFSFYELTNQLSTPSTSS